MKRIYALLILLFFASPAFAVGTMIVAAYYGVSMTAFTIGMTAAAMAINFAVSMVVTRIFAQKPPSPVDNGVREQVPPASTNSLPVVYGDAYLGGVYIDAALSQDQKTMYYVLALSSISPNGQFSYLMLLLMLNQPKLYLQHHHILYLSCSRTKHRLL